MTTRLRLIAFVAAAAAAEVALLASVSPAAGPPDVEVTATAPARTPPRPAPAPTPTKQPRRTVTVLMSGDVLVHSGVWQTAQYDAAAAGRTWPYFRPMFAGVAPEVRAADLAICHLETPLSAPAGPYLNYPLFAAPPQVVDGLKATGYDACTTASNHSVDQGFEGLARTIRALDARGIQHTGTYSTKRASQRSLVMTVDGVRIGLISATYGTNGMPVEKPWSVNLVDVARINAEARQLKRDGVDVVMVAIHAGSEYTHAPNTQQVQIFDALTRSRAVDFVYGHHAHVVQPWAKVNGKWVVYGLGNFVAKQLTEIPGVWRGMQAEITFVERRDGGFRAVRPGIRPLLITKPTDPHGTRVLDVQAALRDPATPEVLYDDLRGALASVRAEALRPGVRVLPPLRRGP